VARKYTVRSVWRATLALAALKSSLAFCDIGALEHFGVKAFDAYRWHRRGSMRGLGVAEGRVLDDAARGSRGVEETGDDRDYA